MTHRPDPLPPISLPEPPREPWSDEDLAGLGDGTQVVQFGGRFGKTQGQAKAVLDLLRSGKSVGVVMLVGDDGGRFEALLAQLGATPEELARLSVSIHLGDGQSA